LAFYENKAPSNGPECRESEFRVKRNLWQKKVMPQPEIPGFGHNLKNGAIFKNYLMPKSLLMLCCKAQIS